MNNEDFVTYDIAQALKKAGFNWDCEYVYAEELPEHEPFSKREDGIRYFQLTGKSLFFSNWIPAPTLAQAQKWLINKGYFVEVQLLARDVWSYSIVDEEGEEINSVLQAWDCYESALSAGIEAALKLIEEGGR